MTHTVSPILCQNASLTVVFNCDDPECDYRGPDTSTAYTWPVRSACAAVLALNRTDWTDTYDGQPSIVVAGPIDVRLESPGAMATWRYGG